jgi:hypothetical protein
LGYFFCFRPEEKTEKVLEEELENCSALLEMEPDSKWTRYARILIMKALDPEKYHQVGKIDQNLHIFQKVKKMLTVIYLFHVTN